MDSAAAAASAATNAAAAMQVQPLPGDPKPGQSPNKLMEILNGEIQSTLAKLKATNNELTWIALNVETYHVLEKWEQRKLQLLTNKESLNQNIVDVSEAIKLYQSSMAKPDADAGEFEQMRARQLDKKTTLLKNLTEQRYCVNEELCVLDDSIARTNAREQLLRARGECEVELEKFHKSLELAEGRHASPINVKRTADEFSGGDAKRLCRSVSQEETDTEQSSSDSDSDSNSDDTSNSSSATSDSTNELQHIINVLLTHVVCISPAQGIKSAHVLMAQQLKMLTNIFASISISECPNGYWIVPSAKIRDCIVQFALKRDRPLAWIACSANKKCEFCHGVDLNFDCALNSAIKILKWNRPARFGGGMEHAFYHDLKELVKRDALLPPLLSSSK